MGTYNMGVGVLRRTPTKPGAPVGAINHEHITEVYYITHRPTRSAASLNAEPFDVMP